MSMHVTASVRADEIAEAMRDDPEFALEVLTCFAEGCDAAALAEFGACTQAHVQTGIWLGTLSQAIAEAEKSW